MPDILCKLNLISWVKKLGKDKISLKNSFPRTCFLLWLAKQVIFNPSHLFKNAILNPPLTSIAIEINSFCNRKCHFCPNFDHTREKVFLDEKLFYKIVNNLSAIKFKGNFTFNLYNEPLLDKRLPMFIDHVRKVLPRAYIYLNTNGDLLDLPLWKEIRGAGLDFANITQYDNKINKNIQEILNGLSPVEKNHIYVHSLDYICNRAGLVETNRDIDINFSVRSPCSRPFCQLNVNYKGKAVLCCNDYLGLVEIGDLHRESVEDIWKSGIFKYYRNELFSRGRANLKLCGTCDMVSE